MLKEHRDSFSTVQPLRLWPGVTIVIVQWLLRFVVPVLIPGAMIVGVMGSMALGICFMLWWLLFSGARWAERIGGIVLMVLAFFVGSMLLHESISTAMMGIMFPVFAIPGLCLAFILWVVFCRRHSDRPKWASMAIILFLATGVWSLVKTAGFSSDMNHDFSWRWSKTAEEQLMVESGDDNLSATAVADFRASDTKWSGFRGANRDSILRNLHLDTDWSSSPPQELWRRSIGPGWSSFAVQGELVFTQEQRGEEEVVSCYHLLTGQPVWKHGDPTRFWEANAGAGPRGTPALSGDRVYALGATGILNALNVGDGSVVWSRHAPTDTGAKMPGWGFSGSPLIVGGKVLVATGGTLVAYDSDSGDLLWKGPNGKDGYSSPHLMTIDGVEQVLLMSKAGAVAIDPKNGSVLWDYDWPGGSRIVQPAQNENGDLLMSKGETSGLSRVSVTNQSGNWSIEEIWTTNRMKPYFSDFVVHKGHVYGFDGNRLVAFNIEASNRVWKGGRYGSGQLLLLADQDLILVITEEGELALAKATPDEFTELARFPALEGKTWNHPVLVGDLLLVRNDQEMAAFRLALVDG